ncbi:MULTISPECIES: MerR family transcriptional regulator [unclassified Streptomyces]|uniref:MerR family transcriptional regulator n=1 Tax=unclassified Streptomyces TaxID=2593676 RepID=UPI000360C64B|nr:MULTISPECIES: MerR family transcriptional regulator [unclassified Streptomyces]MYT30984.1 MerR family transcriptional regulator [Streptomyces sp. SID8354]
MGDLAREAGITVRTLRFYRERKLIPPPRREGRIAWYNEHHLARLRTIAALLERGHTLGGIAELLTAFETGRDVGELLGLPSPLLTPWSEETPVRLTPEELADHFSGEVTPANLTASLALGYLAVDGDEFVHISRRLLDASTSLVAQGIPLAAVLEAGGRVRAHADALADLFTTLIRSHLVTTLHDLPRATEAVENLRPLAKGVVEAELSMAMDRRIRTELEHLLAGGRSTPDGADAGGAATPRTPPSPAHDRSSAGRTTPPAPRTP